MTTRKKIAQNKILGAKGEAVAAKYLMEKGLELIEHNFHAQGGEIDLVMRDPQHEEYVFVEVKTRKSRSFGDGLSAVTEGKIQKILKAIEDYFLKKLELKEVPEFRIDVVVLEVRDGRFFCEHIGNVGLEGEEW